MEVRFRTALTRMVIALSMLAASPAAIAAEDISPAETLLFETNHLKAIRQPLSLYYDFRKSGSLESPYQDTVEIAIEAVAPDGAKEVSTRYLSGERQRNFPPVERARGNPVIMYFLERDIHEMQRLTGGNWRYFQKRIRLALADKAQVRPVKFRRGREEMNGQEIRITPFADDPQKARYEKLAGKYYVFVLSDAIPGGVYQMRAVAPGEKSAQPDGALIEETLTFAKASRK
ncbi:MAG: hypothetical protein ACJ8J7_16055 [Sulfurifustaceae bacterium]